MCINNCSNKNTAMKKNTKMFNNDKLPIIKQTSTFRILSHYFVF